MDEIQKIYIALFGRPADPLGLDYFVRQTSGGTNLAAIGDLAATEEYRSRFDGLTDLQIVNSIYQMLFNRASDAAGLAFFVDTLRTGAQTIDTIAINIAHGARGEDLATLNHKVAAASLFTALVLTGDELAIYSGEGGAEIGRQFLVGVTADISTIPGPAAVKLALGTDLESPDPKPNMPDPQPDPDPGIGEIYTLRASTTADPNLGTETLVGTRYDDIVRALYANSLNSADRIDGGAGLDTLKIGAGGYIAGTSAIVSNIEVITNAETAALDLSLISGVERISSSGSSANYTNASLATVFGTSLSAGGNYAIDFADNTNGASDVIRLAAKDSLTGGYTNFLSPDAFAIERLEIEALGSHQNDNFATIDWVTVGNFIYVTDYKITGGGDLYLIVNPHINATVDGSAATGNLYIQSTVGDGKTLSVTTGAGNDLINCANWSGSAVLDGGTGADKLYGGAGADRLTLNGGDLADGRGGNNLFLISGGLETGLQNSIVGFNNATSDLEFGGTAGTSVNYFESAAIVSTFTTARDAAATEFVMNGALSYVAVDVGSDVAIFYKAGSAITASVVLTGIQFAGVDHTAFV